ncbi:MAG: glycosyltransferase family 2 protein [Bacilli bacterium]|nr:glycosyltransferase family 2 protein [Bacilli bacterium]
MKKVSIILPCYNEEKALGLYFEAVDPFIKEIKDYKFDFVLVNDGSKDNTLNVMNDLYLSRNDITIVSLSRNFGQNPAFSAGLEVCEGDYAILMDADLQDPVELIAKICEKFSEGYEVVNPHRADRSTDSYFKRKTAEMFYKFTNKIEGKEVAPENVNCFRGISRRAIDMINSLDEKDRFIRSEVTFVGYKSCLIDFKREKRSAGESKYNVSKLFTHAFDNISTTTSNPLYFPIKFGAVSSFFCGFIDLTLLILLILSWCDVLSIGMGYTVIFTLFIAFTIFFGVSIIIFFIGIIGIYLHNILINTRNRPSYIIDIVKKPKEK